MVGVFVGRMCMVRQHQAHKKRVKMILDSRQTQPATWDENVRTGTGIGFEAKCDREICRGGALGDKLLFGGRGRTGELPHFLERSDDVDDFLLDSLDFADFDFSEEFHFFLEDFGSTL